MTACDYAENHERATSLEWQCALSAQHPGPHILEAVHMCGSWCDCD